MKAFYLIIAMMLASVSLKSQLYDEYKAKDGLTAAYDIAIEEIENPTLNGIGAINQDKIDFEIPFEVSYNSENGKSEVWVYSFFNIENEEEIVKIPLVKTFLGYNDLRDLYSFDLNFVEFPLVELSNEIIDSDEFANNLNSNSNYNNLKNDYSSSDFEFVGVAADYDDNDEIRTYWVISFTNEENEPSFICYTDAFTGETFCEEAVASVKLDYTLNNEIKVYPQPANDEVLLNVSKQYNNYKLIDLVGNEVKINSQMLLNGNILNLDISNLNSGIYFLILENQTTNDVVRIVKD